MPNKPKPNIDAFIELKTELMTALSIQGDILDPAERSEKINQTKKAIKSVVKEGSKKMSALGQKHNTSFNESAKSVSDVGERIQNLDKNMAAKFKQFTTELNRVPEMSHLYHAEEKITREVTPTVEAPKLGGQGEE